MNIEKSRKRISHKVKRGFQGYPMISIAYFGPDDTLATKVTIGFVAEEGDDVQVEKFVTNADIRKDVTVQTTILKIIERADAQTVTLAEGVVGCPHEEGVDYPVGEECPECPFWHGHNRGA